jgi:hypothetical protein
MFESIYRLLEVLLVYQLFFSVSQIEELFKKLVDHLAPVTVIVRCLQLLFSRIVDIDHLNLFLNKMGTTEREEVYHRLGILNVWNPMYPGLSSLPPLLSHMMDPFTLSSSHSSHPRHGLQVVSLLMGPS